MFDLDYDKEGSEYSFLGNYRGVVVNNIDPYEAGRCQIRIHSVYDDVEDEMLPWAEYCDPFMQGQNGSGGFFVPDIGAKVWCFFENGDHMQPVYFGGAPSFKDNPPNKSNAVGDTPRYGVEYSKNRVINTSAGHTIELDDTPNDSRVRVRHKSGTQIVMYENGDVHEYTTGNYRRYIDGNLEEYVDGSVMRHVTGDSIEVVTGKKENYVYGDSLHAVKGNSETRVDGNSVTTTNGEHVINVKGMLKTFADAGVDINSIGDVYISGTRLYLNSKAPVGAMAATDFEPSAEFANSVENASVLIDVAGPKAGWDEEGESIPPSWPAEETGDSVETPTEIITEEPEEKQVVSADCENITKIDYNYRLSPNFTLGSLTRNTVFPHSIRAQNGLSVSQIICNLKHLCTNILEPLLAKYPKIRINSGFRSGTSGSQHNRGQAVDIQVPGASPAVYSDMAAWIVKNLPYDQFIFEHGKSVWLHLSYNPNLSKQRGVKLTYWPKGSPQYKPGLKNYYDGGKTIS